MPSPAPPIGLIEALDVNGGIVCAVGAGGKKTLLYRLAEAFPGRVAITNTVFAAPVPASVGASNVIARPAKLQERVREAGGNRLAYTLPDIKSGRHAGVPAELVSAIHRSANLDLTLVKADGARMRWLKAPAENEPVLPPGTTRVLVLLSARALGEPLSARVAHRVDAVAKITGLTPGETVNPTAFARLFSSASGVAARTAGAPAMAIINMVDDANRLGLAEQAARAMLDQTDRFDRVVLTRLNDRECPLVAVITR